jgi:peptidoglycan-associated lipoprotein
MNFKTFGTTGMIASMALLAACASTQEEDIVDVVETEEVEVLEPEMSPMEMATMELEQNVGHRVFYGYDQYNLTSEAQATLRRQAAFLQMPENMGIRVLIAGNADERGTREYNLALGQRRADAPKSFLVSLGVDAGRVDTVSYGKERPIDPRSTPEAWAKNRNATTTIVSMGSDMMM